MLEYIIEPSAGTQFR